MGHDDFVGTDDTVPAPPTTKVRPIQVVQTRYEIDVEIGAGGLGRVVRAYDLRLERAVALKTLTSKRDDMKRRFLQEARITARLEHPGIIPVHDSGRFVDGEPYYTMKLVSGRSLHDKLREARTLADRLALLDRVIAVADALAYAHSRGVIHRDLKPLNVLVGEFGETLVIDWGLAKESRVPDEPAPEGERKRSDPVETVAGSVFGTPAWMAPEQARGEELDARADVYAIGVILYTLCTGRMPFEGGTSREILEQVVGHAPAPIEQFEPGVPSDLVAIVRTAMAFDRERRYPTARELAEDLKRFQTGKLVAARSYRTGELVRRWLARNRTSVALTLVFLIGLVVLGTAAVVRVVHERGVAVAQRELADRRADEAQAARRLSDRQTAILTLAQARSAAEQDPARTLAWLKQLAANPARDAVPWEDVRVVAADAVARGVPRHRLSGHAGSVWNLAFTRDGKLVSGGNDGKLAIWDLASGRAIRAAAGELSAFALGDRVAATGDEHAVTLYDSAGRVTRTIAVRSPVLALALARDGSLVAAGTRDGTVVAVALADGTTHELATGSPVHAVAITASGAIVAGADDGVVRLWHPAEPAAAATQVIGEPIVEANADPAAERVVIGDAKRLVEWDLASAHVRPLADGYGQLYGLTRSPDGRWLAVCAELGSRIIDLTGKLPERKQPAEWIAFAPDNQTVAITLKDYVTLIDLGTGAESVLQSPGISSGAAFSPDGHTLVTAGADGSLLVWQLPAHPPRAWHEPIGARGIVARRDGRSVIWRRRDHMVVAVDLVTGARSELDAGEFPIGFVPAADDAQLWVTTVQGAILALDFATHTVRVVAKYPHAVACVSEHAGMLAFVDVQHVVRVIDAHTFAELASYTRKDEINACSFTPSGDLALGYDDGPLELVAARTGQSLARDPGHHAQITTLTVASTGEVLTAGRDGDVRGWVPGRPSRVITHHDAAVWGLAVSADAQRVASSGSDHTARLSTIDGKLLQVFRASAADVSGLAFAPDRSWLAATSMDGNVRVWPIDETAAPPGAPDQLAAWLAAHTSVTIADATRP